MGCIGSAASQSKQSRLDTASPEQCAFQCSNVPASESSSKWLTAAAQPRAQSSLRLAQSDPSLGVPFPIGCAIPRMLGSAGPEQSVPFSLSSFNCQGQVQPGLSQWVGYCHSLNWRKHPYTEPGCGHQKFWMPSSLRWWCLKRFSQRNMRHKVKF